MQTVNTSTTKTRKQASFLCSMLYCKHLYHFTICVLSTLCYCTVQYFLPLLCNARRDSSSHHKI